MGPAREVLCQAAVERVELFAAGYQAVAAQDEVEVAQVEAVVAQFRDLRGACKLIETAVSRGDQSMARRLSECRGS